MKKLLNLGLILNYNFILHALRSQFLLEQIESEISFY